MASVLLSLFATAIGLVVVVVVVAEAVAEVAACDGTRVF